MYFCCILFFILTYAIYDGDTEGRSSNDLDSGPQWCPSSCNQCHELCLEEDNQRKRLPRRIAWLSCNRQQDICQQRWNGWSKWHQQCLFEATAASQYVGSSSNTRPKHLQLTIAFVILLVLISAAVTLACMCYLQRLKYERRYKKAAEGCDIRENFGYLEDFVEHRKESAIDGYQLESNKCEETALQHFDPFISYSADDKDLIWSLAKQLENNSDPHFLINPRNLTDCSPQHVENHLPNSIQTVEYLRKQLCSATGGEASLNRICEDEGLLVGEIDVILELSPQHSSKDYNATVCILGHTGMGKSALCNLLSGLQQQDPDSFRVAPYFYEDRTQNCDVRNVKWMGKGQEFMIVDTPGLGTEEDPRRYEDIAETLRSVGNINKFILVLNSQSLYLSKNEKTMLSSLESMLGRDFWKHVILVFTRWDYSHEGDARRLKSGECREKIYNIKNNAIVNSFNLDGDLQAAFIDNYPDWEDPVQHERLSAECSVLHDKLLKSSSYYDCQQIQTASDLDLYIDIELIY